MSILSKPLHSIVRNLLVGTATGAAGVVMFDTTGRNFSPKRWFSEPMGALLRCRFKAP